MTKDANDIRNCIEGRPDSSGIRNIVKPFFNSNPITHFNEYHFIERRETNALEQLLIVYMIAKEYQADLLMTEQCSI